MFKGFYGGLKRSFLLWEKLQAFFVIGTQTD